MQYRKLCALILSSILFEPLGTAEFARAETMYAITDGCPGVNGCVPSYNGVARFYSIDTVTGVQTVISNDLGTGPLQALAAMPSGTMYSISTIGSLLIAIDPVTGVATNTGTQVVTPWPIYSLAANANGDLYGVTVGPTTADLYKINPSTGATLVGNLGRLTTAGLDFSPSGVLYGASGNLFTINTSTGQATVVLDNPQPVSAYSSIAFDPTGKLWGITKNSSGPGRLFTINTINGNQDFVPFFGLDGSITGIEFLTPVPVPAALWLFGSGLFTIAGLARHRKLMIRNPSSNTSAITYEAVPCHGSQR